MQTSPQPGEATAKRDRRGAGEAPNLTVTL
jgi:hypothetical protein